MSLKQVFLLLGTNVGNKKQNLNAAVQLIEEKIAPLTNKSRIYETEPWGVQNQDNYYNQALALEVNLEPEALIDKILEIELLLGRVREKRWAPRTIDIDILLIDDSIIKTDRLTVPHPRIQNRNFALIPLMEIAGEKIHPVFDKDIETLFWDSEDPLAVFALEEDEITEIEK